MRFFKIPIVVYFICATILSLLLLAVGYTDDPFLYECYGTKFLENSFPIQLNLSHQACEYIQKGGTVIPENLIFPLEYPALSTIFFVLPYLLPVPFIYSFALEMVLLILLICYFLYRKFGVGSVYVFLFLILLGNWFTAVQRFDLLPSTLVFLSLLAANKKRFNLAYLFLALAVLTKYYALPLVIPLFIAEQQSLKLKRFSFHQLLVFSILVTAGILISFVVNAAQTISSIKYYLLRPIEIESLQASVYYLASQAFSSPVCYQFSYGVINVASTGNSCSGEIGWMLVWLPKLFLVLFGLGFLAIIYLQFKNRLQLPSAFLLILLLMIIFNKVLSPQFLLWVTPLVVLLLFKHSRYLFFWGVICLMTTIIYPFAFLIWDQGMVYQRVIPFWPVTVLRNFLLVLFIVGFWKVSLKKVAVDSLFVL